MMMQAVKRAGRTSGAAAKWLLGNSRCASSQPQQQQQQRTQPELTAVRYKVERGPYARISDAHAAHFEGLLGSTRVITEPDECDSYNIDWLRIVKGGWFQCVCVCVWFGGVRGRGFRVELYAIR